MSSKLIAIVVLIAMMMIVDFNIVHTAEKCVRKQANYKLEQMVVCLDETLKHVDRSTALQTCMSRSRTTHTGDAYALDAYTLEFLYDASNDTTKIGPLYFTEESVGKFFQDWKSAEKFLYTLTLGKDSDMSPNMHYRFDDADEWLEWKYYPSDMTRDYDKPKWILVQGAQSDEVLRNFSTTRWVLQGGTLIAVLILLILHVRYNGGILHKGKEDAVQ
jgi:hypothetical protein